MISRSMQAAALVAASFAVMALAGEATAGALVAVPLGLALASSGTSGLVAVAVVLYLGSLLCRGSASLDCLGSSVSLAGLYLAGGLSLAQAYQLSGFSDGLSLLPVLLLEGLLARFSPNPTRTQLALVLAAVTLAMLVGIAPALAACAALVALIWLTLDPDQRPRWLGPGQGAVSALLLLSVCAGSTPGWDWAASLVLMAALFWLIRHVLKRLHLRLPGRMVGALGLAAVALPGAGAAAPVLPAGVALLALAFYRGSPRLATMARWFLPVGAFCYYYAGGSTFTVKAVVLLGAGLGLLLARQSLLGYLEWSRLRQVSLLARLRAGLAQALARFREELGGLSRTAPMVLTLGLVLVGTAALVAFKEIQIARGSTLYLPLVPVDPRSLMQGDYMALSYEFSRNVEWPGEGSLVVTLDEHLVGKEARLFASDQTLGPSDVRLRFRNNGSSVRIGAESYLFEEGQDEALKSAAYAELLVTPEGDCVLRALCDGSRRRIDPRPLPSKGQ